MGDDFTTDDILLADTDTTDAADFDPNAVESDDFLDDPEEALLAEDLDGLAVADDEEDEDDDIFGVDE